MIARLPMYDRPENAAAHDALWSGVRDILGYGDPQIDRETAYDEGWGCEDLQLGQLCNLHYRTNFRNRVTRIGCADYSLQDTPAGYYHSVFVVRAEDASRGLAPATLGRFAYNDALSQSGWGAPLARVNDMGLTFHTTVRTGAHYDSMLAVADGRADLTAIDAVTWRMFEAWEPRATELRVVGRTGLSPGMTFITAPQNDAAAIRAALQSAISTLAPEHADTLGLRGLVVLPDAAYDMALAAAP
ncbi:PhnD/SsuA/transferrin family substrate-binding protein [Octadecabacter sp. 1_MG-2023]|uniref:phosphate/phosphite/phosphonate ABC transporter substrate-binding protein n=1 Tax=unclassified Octadecabacter TaxID=196158 RepID=UPI001C0A50D0|nr:MULTISPECIES: PhnD/SsuA/transferrin family substrate-binding protein [unclassified Octadecabacter]MBU2992847.1 PhnD/SsuA/transferrin family substrate-binding protein [Octadecabacter sp. B2R22]MDO6733702.1 PhnD/SsuA/transferrin family substrate-binding protein [Octadecabacter sp. 1_MG-2023]